MTLIIAVDPGLPQCAWSVWRVDEYVESGVWRSKENASEEDNLRGLFKYAKELSFNADRLFIEGAWFNPHISNFESITVLIRSHVPWVLAYPCVPVTYVHPSTWRAGMGCPFKKKRISSRGKPRLRRCSSASRCANTRARLCSSAPGGVGNEG